MATAYKNAALPSDCDIHSRYAIHFCVCVKYLPRRRNLCGNPPSQRRWFESSDASWLIHHHKLVSRHCTRTKRLKTLKTAHLMRTFTEIFTFLSRLQNGGQEQQATLNSALPIGRKARHFTVSQCAVLHSYVPNRPTHRNDARRTTHVVDSYHRLDTMAALAKHGLFTTTRRLFPSKNVNIAPIKPYY